jgi:hypothetical protein
MTFAETLTAAVQDISRNGYDNAVRLEGWLHRLRAAAEAETTSPEKLAAGMRQILGSTYARMVDGGGALKANPGVSRFTLEAIRPHLHRELERRVLASADLIKRNKAQMVDRTIQRFSGWATSVPPGGSRAVDKREVKASVTKPLRQQSFEERRVLIDQGHKLAGNINQIVAEGSGAIAVEWHSRWREVGYNYRPDHKARDRLVYALRGNWAMEKGLMKPGPNGYYDAITAVGEEPFCRCSAVFYHSVGELPDDMVTAKGRAELARVREALRA